MLFSFAVFLFACGQAGRQNDRPDINPKEYKEPLMEANKIRVQREDVEIDNYIKRHQWDMKETGTGLRYLIYHEDGGEKAMTGKTAVINFKISLLDGTACYSSENNGPKKFTIGQGGVESGLEEGILLLKVGDKAKFILPSHLAYGLLGDGDKIPSHVVIIYEVELINLK
ncbi:MAG: FKBP-type peptidyl-prolyl cis-trans isomerase [Bacteroidetes bacterium]|nr:FKBP-type peptidyl-prolyl cis-trans isomerase [Bacteroidota bacterium]